MKRLSSRRLNDAFAAGDLATARHIQLDILPACRVIYAEPNPGPLKVALEMAGWGAGPTRPPIYPVSRATREALESVLPSLLKAEKAANRANVAA